MKENDEEKKGGKNYGNTDEREKSRKLTAAEERRLENFKAVSEKLESEGYTGVELTVCIVKANVFALVLFVVLMAAAVLLFYLVNRQINMNLDIWSYLLFFAIMLVFVVVHELIHGISWAIFAERHFKDIEFGFMKEYLTPYCTCKSGLSMGQYIFGSLMPLVVLGIIPMIAGIFSGSLFWTFMGVVMADSAAGDILVVLNILRHRSGKKDVLYMDHPTQAGGVLFER